MLSKIKIFSFILLLFTSVYGTCQTIDQSKQEEESSSKVLKSKNPALATTLSAVIPGAGQIYNQKYWKLPIIYGGFATLIYFTSSNHKEYVKFRDAYELKMQAGGETINPPYPGVPAESLQRERERWRRYRDLNIIGMGLLYIINVIDANVDANLFDYDVSEDLTLKICPEIEYIGKAPIITQQTPFYGVGFSIKF